MKHVLRMLTLVLLCVLLPACGGGGEQVPADTSAAPTAGETAAGDEGEEAEGEVDEGMAPEGGVAAGAEDEGAPEEDENVPSDEDEGDGS